MIMDNGTMCGGGEYVKRGKMRLGNAPPSTKDPALARANLQHAQQRLQQMEKQLVETQAAVRDGTAAAAAAKKAATAADLQLRKRELEIQSDERKHGELQLQVAELQQKVRVRGSAQWQAAYPTLLMCWVHFPDLSVCSI